MFDITLVFCLPLTIYIYFMLIHIACSVHCQSTIMITLFLCFRHLVHVIGRICGCQYICTEATLLHILYDMIYDILVYNLCIFIVLTSYIRNAPTSTGMLYTAQCYCQHLISCSCEMMSKGWTSAFGYLNEMLHKFHIIW